MVAFASLCRQKDPQILSKQCHGWPRTRRFHSGKARLNEILESSSHEGCSRGDVLVHRALGFALQHPLALQRSPHGTGTPGLRDPKSPGCWGREVPKDQSPGIQHQGVTQRLLQALRRGLGEKQGKQWFFPTGLF